MWVALITKEAKKNKTKIIPMNSEHFSIMNLLKNHNVQDINKVYLTASGGPFLNYKFSQLKNIEPQKALKASKMENG